jgi:hypothetical protein
MTAPAITEKEWQETVVQLATYCRWHHFHPYDSRRSTPGWPDLVLVRAPEFIVVELKTETGKLRPEQVDWLTWLAQCGVETHVWRPSDFDEVVARLR